jgi:dynein heavy chain
MTAVRQTHARKTRTPIDALVFKTHVCACFADGITAEPEAGVILYGVFLEGARWDFGRSCLEDSEPGKSVIPFPCVWLEPVEVTTPLEEGCYSCPLYKTSTRRGELLTTGHSTNFVGYLHLPTEAPGDYWLRRGAALLTMTDD